MKDFGALTTEYTSCSLCGSGKHTSVDHRALNDAAPELLAFANAMYEELDNRYDGAEDSRTKWMGEWLTKAADVIRKAEGRS